ncbi:hypothetical protein CMUS01_03844 [Colletotrichum musicola]|uniref:Uncharacterized protein n=1 Tax=Colletotrichum musicola TaxID=2175873 RepID=A0A8H6NQK5_9PEZI|nr:hypothetical protein CMUS01_03844 [Colletotrichum musicola]
MDYRTTNDTLAENEDIVIDIMVEQRDAMAANVAKEVKEEEKEIKKEESVGLQHPEGVLPGDQHFQVGLCAMRFSGQPGLMAVPGSGTDDRDDDGQQLR